MPEPTVLSEQYAHRSDLRTIARRVVAEELRRRIEDIAEQWDSYPEIGEYDWDAVVRHVERLADTFDPTPSNYDAAYQRVAAKAGDDA